MNTDHYLDLHMSRIMLLTFWHIFLVLFNFWRAFYARYSHKMTCIFRSVSVIVRVNGVPSKWLYFVSCWCCQCRCLFASFSTCNMRARHKWHPLNDMCVTSHGVRSGPIIPGSGCDMNHWKNDWDFWHFVVFTDFLRWIVLFCCVFLLFTFLICCSFLKIFPHFDS